VVAKQAGRQIAIRDGELTELAPAEPAALPPAGDLGPARDGDTAPLHQEGDGAPAAG
jgi:hypothetical protein